MHFFSHTLAVAAALGLLAGAGTAQAQQVYRIVGPDGKVTFSDRSPSNEAPVAAEGRAATVQDGGASSALPYALGQIAARFPVTLYTAADCAPCASARNLLVSRGVPFTERTVGSNEDIEALKRLSGNTSLPFGSIGNQQLQGFSDSEWTQYLNAAGYPTQSQLPPSYRRPAATPLVAIKRAEPAARPNEDRTPATPNTGMPLPAQGPAPSNPAGIRF